MFFVHILLDFECCIHAFSWNMFLAVVFYHQWGILAIINHKVYAMTFFPF